LKPLLLIALVLAACNAPAGETNITPSPASFQAMSEEVRYIPRYLLNPGDTLKASFLVRPDRGPAIYKIEAGDTLKVKVFHHTEIDDTYFVRPDGKISLPYKGAFKVVGLTPEEARDQIANLYADLFRDPVVALQVTTFGKRLEELKSILGSAATGQSLQTVIGPDGFFSLPLVGEFAAAGRVVTQVQEAVEAAYIDRFPELEVGIQLSATAGFGVFVQGEVTQPGRIGVTGPITASRALAMAGGAHLATSDLENCILLTMAPDGVAEAHRVNLYAVLEEGDVSRDALMGPNDVLVVPSTSITRVNRWVDQYIAKMLLFRGFGVSAAYRIDSEFIAQ
jgi:protein involved in polysaccharide export with SLBB domain